MTLFQTPPWRLPQVEVVSPRSAPACRDAEHCVCVTDALKEDA